MCCKGCGDHFDRRRPMLRIVRARLRVDILQSVGRGGFQFETQPIAGVFQFVPARLLPLFFPTECDGHVYHPISRLAHQPQCQAAAMNAIKIHRSGCERKNQNRRGVRRGRRSWLRRDLTERKGFSLCHQRGNRFHEFKIRIPSHHPNRPFQFATEPFPKQPPFLGVVIIAAHNKLNPIKSQHQMESNGDKHFRFSADTGTLSGQAVTLAMN